MANDEIKQKLTAILSADVKDYSRLMSQDRIGTIETLKSYRNVITDFVSRYIGRVIDTPGDNILAEFDSVSDAVNCAVEIQRELAERNAEVPSARMMEWRIGINLGEVIEEEGRIYGDGVNIAARIEGLAEPGSICISGTAYDQIQGKLGLEYESLGEQEVKNISKPVRVYRVLSYPGAAAHRVVKAKADVKKTWRNAAFIISALIAVGIGSVLIWNYIKRPTVPLPETVMSEAAAPVEKPAIAVLPFKNMSDDPQQEYFSDGMTEEIINALAKNPGFIVASRTSSFSSKVKDQDARTIGEMLNVTHVVEGSVRKSGNRIRLTAQLIKTDEDAHIWSERYDRELTDVFEVQDEITAAILNSVSIHLVGSSDKQIRTANMEAYNAYLLGRYHFNRFELDEAVDELEKSVSLDPNNADVYGLLAATHQSYIFTELNPAQEIWPIIRNYADKALSLNPNQSDALDVRFDIRFYADRAYQDIINELANFLQQHPNDTNILLTYDDIFRTIGRLDLAFRVFDRIVELDPLWPIVYQSRGWAFYQAGRYDEARKSFERAEMLGTNESVALAAIAGCEGDVQALQKQLDRGQSNWGEYGNWYPLHRALASYLKDDHKKVKEILSSLWQTASYIPFYKKSHMAALEGDLDLALDYYEQAISESEYLPIWFIQGTFWNGKIFPDYRSHPKFQKMLKNVGLDDESVAKLKIPPLPF